MFKAKFGAGIPVGLTRVVLSDEMKKLGDKMHAEVLQRAKGAIVSLAVDGWTNKRHRYNISSGAFVQFIFPPPGKWQKLS